MVWGLGQDGTDHGGDLPQGALGHLALHQSTSSAAE
jgi:hypothetical protein